MKNIKKKLISAAIAGILSVGAISSANATYSVIDASQIATIKATAAGKIAEMVTIVGQQIQQMSLDTMLNTLQMQNDQNIAANTIMRTTQVMSDIHNLNLSKSLLPSIGICGNVSASMKIADASCEINEAKTRVALNTSKRHLMTEEEMASTYVSQAFPNGGSSQEAQIAYRLEKLNEANASAAGSRVQTETVSRAILGDIGELTKEEYDVILKTLELTSAPAIPVIDANFNDTRFYAADTLNRNNTLLVEQTYMSSLLRLPTLNTQSETGPSFLGALRSAVNQYYGTPENALNGQAPATVTAMATAEGQPVELAIKELLNVESLGLYIDYLSLEQSLRIEALLGMLVKQNMDANQ